RDPSWHRRRIGVYTLAMQTDVRAMDAVIFDLGGVVLDSPLHAIARYERERGLPANAVNLAVVTAGEAGAWARLKRGELTVEDFCAPCEADCRAAGVVVDARDLMARIAATTVARPEMLEAVRRIRARGLRVAALTNNWLEGGSTVGAALRHEFDVFVESAATG